MSKGSGQTWGPEPHISDYAMDIMRTESIVSAVFALGTAASAWFGWPFALTAGCAIVSAVFALIAGRKD